MFLEDLKRALLPSFGGNNELDPNTGLSQQQMALMRSNMLMDAGMRMVALGQQQTPEQRARVAASFGNNSIMNPAALAHMQNAGLENQLRSLQIQKLKENLNWDIPTNAVQPPSSATTINKAADTGMPTASTTAVPTGAPVLTPTDIQYIRSFSTGDERQAAYKQIMAKKLLETREQEVPLTDEERAANNIPQGQPAFKKLKIYPSGNTEVTGYNVPNFQRPEGGLLKGLDEAWSKDFADMRNEIRRSPTVVNINNQMLDLLDKGIFSGQFSGEKLVASKGLKTLQSWLGIENPKEMDELIKNTELLKTRVLQTAIQKVKELGTNPSNADLKIVQMAQAGELSLDENTMRELFMLSNKDEINKINKYNDNISALEEPGVLDDNQKRRYMSLFKKMDIPKTYAPQSGLDNIPLDQIEAEIERRRQQGR